MKVCFFSNTSLRQLESEQYSVLDRRILREYGFEVVVANNIFQIPLDCDLYYSWWAAGSFIPLVISKIAGSPNIMVAGGLGSMKYRDSITNTPQGYLAQPYYKRMATRIALRKSTVVTVVSDVMLEDTKQLANRDVFVIPNCIDTNLFKPNEGAFRSYITTVFRQDEDTTKLKRGDIFIEAAARVVEEYPSQRFVLIGYNGNSFERLRERVKNLGLLKNFIFAGLISNCKVHEWLSKSIAYVQISDMETFGVSVAEAMSTGIPVVVSRRGALPDLVGAEGVYVNHNCSKSVADGIKDVIKMDYIERLRKGNILRDIIIEKYSYERRKKRFYSIIDSCISE